MKSLITPAAVVSGAAVGSIAGPGGAALGSGIGYAMGEVYTLKDENKQLVTAITTGDVRGIVAAQMKGQEGKIQEVTSGIWTTLKVAAFVVLGILCIPLFITRSNAKKLNKICEETKNAKTD
jgi:H+/Cl- antiporter ClcA